MKLSERTLQILKNFSTINTSIFVRPGNVLSTTNTAKTILATAEIRDRFSEKFCIYDLSRFLGTISLFDDPDFDFQEDFVTISSGKQRINYVYASESMIAYPLRSEIVFDDIVVEFDLTNEQLSKLKEAGSILQMPMISFIGDEGTLSVRAVNPKTPSADMFSMDVGETDKNFKIFFKPENFKFIKDNYRVTVGDGVVKFATIDKYSGLPLTYWVATEAKTK